MSLAAPLPSRRPLVLSDLLPGALVRDVALVLGGAAFVGLSAQVAIPVPGTPVPVTGQTFAVLRTGAALGWRRAVPSMLVYLLVGMAGVPWFTGGGSGTGAPTLGYVAGFVLAAALVGALAARGGDRTPARTALTMLLGTLVIYLVGVPYLAAALDTGLGDAVARGMRPFLLGDALKVALAAGLLPAAWTLVRRHHGDGGRTRP